MTYGCQIWSLKKEEYKKLKVTQNPMESVMLKIKKNQHNQEQTNRKSRSKLSMEKKMGMVRVCSQIEE